MNKLKNIVVFYRQWDPLELMKNDFPEDEYDVAASELLWWFEKNQSASSTDIAGKAYKAFVDRMLGQKSKKLESEFVAKAEEIKTALVKDL